MFGPVPTYSQSDKAGQPLEIQLIGGRTILNRVRLQHERENSTPPERARSNGAAIRPLERVQAPFGSGGLLPLRRRSN